MKKYIGLVLLLIMLMTALSVNVFAAPNTQSYAFELTVDGRKEKQVETGDVITVVLSLNRTDCEEAYTMYAMQDEIRYDSRFFELVEGSQILSEGIHTKDIAMRDRYRELYMNYLSLDGGSTWPAQKPIGSFQLRVIGNAGVTKITSQDYLVSLQDGRGSYPCQADELTIILSDACTVHFETNGGSAVEEMVVNYGDRIMRPADPQKDGNRFEGWYRDIDCTQEWHFETDTVCGNLTLYAKWSQVPVDATDNVSTGMDGFSYFWLLAILPPLLILVLVLIKHKTYKAKH